MKASDIMTSKVVTVRPDADLATLARLLLDNKISAAPVVDEEDHLIGIISEDDLLGLPPAQSLRAWWLRLFDDEAVCLEELANARHLRVGDVMTRHVVAVLDQAPIDLVVGLMHRRKLKRVPVIRDGKLVGIVSRGDLLDALVGRRGGPAAYSLGDLG
jgi:CBS domain-containing protein